MSSGVFVLKDQQTLIPMQPASFASEEDFQRLLANFPALLAGEQIDAIVPRKWLLVAREPGIPSEENGSARWAIDHVFLDQNGVPTLVEVKRSTDTRIRREVVGQMLDYAANCVVYWPVEELRRQFEATCTGRGDDPSETIADLIGLEADIESFWDQVKTNLRAGKVRMLFVADHIPSELKRIVEFLNEQMDPAEVLALELRQFEGQGLKTLVPILYGQTQEAQQNKAIGAPKRSWDMASICAELERKSGPGAVRAAEQIHAWIKNRADGLVFGKGAKEGSMGAEFLQSGKKFYPLSLWTGGKGAVSINFGWIKKPPFDSEERRQELLRRVNEIDGVNLPDSDSGRNIPLSLLYAEPQLKKLFSAMDWFLEELRHS